MSHLPDPFCLKGSGPEQEELIYHVKMSEGERRLPIVQGLRYPRPKEKPLVLKPVGVAEVRETPSLTGETVRGAHRVLEHT